MIVVCIGAEALAIAAVTVPLMERFVEPVEVVTDGTDPIAVKLAVLGGVTKPTIVCDVDVVFRQPFPTAAGVPVDGSSISAVRAVYGHLIPTDYRDRVPLVTCNTGLLVVQPQTRAVFERARQIRAEIGDEFFADEGPVNMALLEFDTHVEWLRPEFNRQLPFELEQADDVGRHHLGRAGKLMRVKRDARRVERTLVRT